MCEREPSRQQNGVRSGNGAEVDLHTLLSSRLPKTHPGVEIAQMRGDFQLLFSPPFPSRMHSHFSGESENKASALCGIQSPTHTRSGHLIPIIYYFFFSASCSSLSGPPAFIRASARPTDSLPATVPTSLPVSSFPRCPSEKLL